MKDSQRKSVKLVKRLEAQICEFPHGARLPPLRSLSRLYGVSMTTVNSAMKLLEEKGRIERRQGSGVFFRRPSGEKRVVFIRTDFPSVVYSARQVALRKIFENNGWTFSIAQTSHRLPDDFFEFSGHFDAIILNSHTFLDGSVLERHLLHRGVPIVLLGHQPTQIKTDSVSGDDFHGMGLLFRHLTERGHRRIALFVNEPCFSEIVARCDAFEKFSRIFGTEAAPVIHCNMENETPDELGILGSRMAMQTMKAYLSEHSEVPFTALIAMSDQGAFIAQRALYEHGVPLSECHVTGFDDTPMSSLCIPSLTTLTWDLEDMAGHCFEIIKERLAGDASPVQARKSLPSLIVRESTGGNIPSSNGGLDTEP